MLLIKLGPFWESTQRTVGMISDVTTKAEADEAYGDSPVAAGKVDSEGSYVEGLLVRLKVQDSDQYFLLQTVRAVLEPVGFKYIQTFVGFLLQMRARVGTDALKFFSSCF